MGSAPHRRAVACYRAQALHQQELQHETKQLVLRWKAVAAPSAAGMHVST